MKRCKLTKAVKRDYKTVKNYLDKKKLCYNTYYKVLDGESLNRTDVENALDLCGYGALVLEYREAYKDICKKIR
jgi:hypothetical protein